MSILAVVSYPVLAEADRQWIESLRVRHDPQATLLPAHFTLVFPADLRSEPLAREIGDVASVSRSISFTLRWARPVRDVFADGGHVFLVPDDGFDRMTALHEALYRGTASASRRSDVPFIPHITVAANRDLTACEQIARDLTPLDRLIRGRLQKLSLLEITPNSVTTLEEFQLNARPSE